MCKKLPYFKFFPADWLTSPDVMAMSLAEQGAYIKALAMMWNSKNCTLPADEEKLKRIIDPSGETDWPMTYMALKDVLQEHDGQFYNRRLQLERDAAIDRSEKAKAAGEASGVARRGKKPKKKPVEVEEEHRTPEEIEAEVQAELAAMEERKREAAKKKKLAERKQHITKEKRQKSEPTEVADIVQDAIPKPGGQIIDIEGEIRAWVGEKNWKKSYGFYRWFLLEIPNSWDAIEHIRDSKDPEVRRAKDMSEVKNVGGFMRGWAKRHHLGPGVMIPYDNTLNPKYPDPVEFEL